MLKPQEHPKNLLRLFLTSESYFLFPEVIFKPLRKYTAKKQKMTIPKAIFNFGGYF